LTLEDISMERARRSEEEAIAEERRRIAREIHDGLAQDLASLRFKVRLWHDLLDRDPSKMHAELNTLREVLEKNIRDVRRSIFSLRPVALEGMDFFLALRQFVDEFGEQNQLRTELDISGPEDCLSRHLELMLFRIIQEGLNNVGKHAHASQVWIELNLAAPDAMLCLRIRDNGVGFDPLWVSLSQSARQGHLGLKHMRERVEGLNGTFSLHSQTGEGTEIRIRLPFIVIGGDE
jgi:signal transduction histidine kinase